MMLVFGMETVIQRVLPWQVQEIGDENFQEKRQRKASLIASFVLVSSGTMPASALY